MKLKISSKMSKIRMPIVHADLIFLYVQIVAKQNFYGFTRGDLSTRVPGFPGNSRNLGNYEGRLAREGQLALPR